MALDLSIGAVSFSIKTEAAFSQPIERRRLILKLSAISAGAAARRGKIAMAAMPNGRNLGQCVGSELGIEHGASHYWAHGPGTERSTDIEIFRKLLATVSALSWKE